MDRKESNCSTKCGRLRKPLIKALGTGFHLIPTNFEIPLSLLESTKTEVFRFPHILEVIWQLENISSNDFVACLAYQTA